MNAALIRTFDAPPIYVTFPDPVAAAGEQHITVSAAGLYQIVKSLANGTHYGSNGELPFILVLTASDASPTERASTSAALVSPTAPFANGLW
jgi:hypothetical protein